jgi:hypothetical protein
MEKKTNAYRIFVEKVLRKRLLDTAESGFRYNIKLDLRDVIFEKLKMDEHGLCSA